MPEIIFIGGCPRSGTTAMARLLNVHDRVVVGYERYGKRFMDKLPQDAFDRERFFAVTPGDAFYSSFEEINWDPYRTWREAYVKFDNALVVGDKIPKIYGYLKEIADYIPSAKFIMMVRNLYDVASSYEARVADSADPLWQDDFAVAAADWNESLYAIKTWTVRHRMLVVSYEDLFLRGEGLDRILEFLGVEITDSLTDVLESFRQDGIALDTNHRRRLSAAKVRHLLIMGNFEDYKLVLGQPDCIRARDEELDAQLRQTREDVNALAALLTKEEGDSESFNRELGHLKQCLGQLDY